MTILEIKNLIFKYFTENDTLVLPDNFNKIILISENPEMDLASLKESLKSYVELGLVKSVEFEDNKKKKVAYVLEKPLQNYEQSVVISGEIGLYIAQILNDVKDQDDHNVVNPLSITQENIESMIILITQLLKEYKKNQEKSGAELDEED